MTAEGAEGGEIREWLGGAGACDLVDVARGEQSDRGGLDVSLDAGDLAGEEHALVARYLDELTRAGAATPLPYHTALGALGRHVSESSPDRYQPSNVTWALIEDVIGRAKKIEKRERQVARAIETIEKIVA